MSDEQTGTRGWWASLKHGGMLIAPGRLAEFFPDEPGPPPWGIEDRLRRDLNRLAAREADALPAFLETVLAGLVGLGRANTVGAGTWLKGNAVSPDWTQRALTGEAIKPRWVWQGPAGAVLPLFVTDEQRLGIGRGRHAPARVVEWLRKASRRIALLTNGRQWRIVYAGLDHEAFAEADAALWFEGGLSAQVTALRMLLAPDALTAPAVGETPRLLAAIEVSRRGQAELSAVLGERVRQAVELLIREHGAALAELVADGTVKPRDVYLAAVRVVMRMVVVLFAEARDLLPRENPVYHGSYGLGGLRELLERAAGSAGAERLRHRAGAWPRVLALFRLVHGGSPHVVLPILRYGGSLFEPGDPASTDQVNRALALLEDPSHAPSDAVVHRMLELLTRSRVRVRQGAQSTWVEAPVDFSDLSSEYLGILYEGLLDFELRCAAANDPIVFLNLGDEPALPLSRLEAMSEATLVPLLKKFKEKRQLQVGDDDEEGDSEAGDGEEEIAEGGDEAGDEDAGDADLAADAPPDDDDDARRAVAERARQWARRAAVKGKLVRKPSSQRAEALAAYEAALDRTAARLVRVVLPGEWYLVRFGGTRKGSGSFYTRPALAVPTSHRTLRPLAFEPPTDANGQPDETAKAAAWTPKKPEQILALKVCDPACGSGSFLVAAVRFLTDALAASLHAHGRVRAHGDQALVTLAEGKSGGEILAEELLPRRPDAPDFDDRLRARLKRHIVERCIYGVDIDPLAVELCRLALWVETMDRELPFSFLDHKVKCGNSLVGGWFDRFQDYPVLAWEREGGDKGHKTGTHFRESAWTKAIKDFRAKEVKNSLRSWLSNPKQLRFEAMYEGKSADAVHDEALSVLEEMHALPVQDVERRCEFYRERLVNNPALEKVKQAFDAWCAVWFWPGDQLEHAPLANTLGSLDDEGREIVCRLTREHRFFHWEVEFPDVFAAAGGGFDAVLGNPPWEIQKPNSKEFFSNLDPLYRTYGKQEALARQSEIFGASRGDEEDWLRYCARYKALSNFVKFANDPFGDPEGDGKSFPLGAGGGHLHDEWRDRRAVRRGYVDPAHPFRWQGSADVNTYKLFLEQAHALLREGGQLGLIAPSGVYTDKGSTDLRRLFLEQCQWQWLFGFENREGIFDIHRSFKFCAVIVRKGGGTKAIRTAFMRRRLSDWEEGEAHAIGYARAQVDRLSPRSRAFLEVGSDRDLQVLNVLYSAGTRLNDNTLGVRYSREFHMGDDSRSFTSSPVLLDRSGHWLCPGVWENEDGLHLSLLEGRMVEQHWPLAKSWVSGKGRSAAWRESRLDATDFVPQYFMREATVRQSAKFRRGWKLGLMNVTSATNSRTVKACLIPPFPCGDSVYTLTLESDQDAIRLLALSAVLNSFAFDFMVRMRLGGLHLSEFVLGDACAPTLLLNDPGFARILAVLVARLEGTATALWPVLLTFSENDAREIDKERLAVIPYERLRLGVIIDALVAHAYGLSFDDLAWILRCCDLPRDTLRSNEVTAGLPPKGFWRVDSDVEPERRSPVLVMAAFRALEEAVAKARERMKAVRTFCGFDSEVGWQMPGDWRIRAPKVDDDAEAEESERAVEAKTKEFWVEVDQVFSDLRSRLKCYAWCLDREAEREGGLIEGADHSIAAESDDVAAAGGGAAGSQRRLFPGEPTLFGRAMEDAPRRRRKR